MMLKFGRLLPFFIFVLLATFLWRGLSLEPQRLPSVQLGKKLPNMSLPLLTKSKSDFSQSFNADLLKGRMALLIVWASWCATCQEEALFLDELAQRGIALYGINYKDDLVAAKQWLQEWGNPFRAIGIDSQGKYALNLGVYGAPEAYLIDAQGIIRHRYAGALTSEIWQREFVPKIAFFSNSLQSARGD
ncbi:MAG TPA: DsbE family thiol:disulfide interchange protein [Legionellaceae bacterium]|nr:DsbE family thiol:disulfide interchange protein [Legionellaceae bacterium]